MKDIKQKVNWSLINLKKLKRFIKNIIEITGDY